MGVIYDVDPGEFDRAELQREFIKITNRRCPDCHGWYGEHNYGCPGDPGECDETPEDEEESEDDEEDGS